MNVVNAVRDLVRLREIGLEATAGRLVRDREPGRVDLAALPEQARRNYLAACERIGSEYSTPLVLEAALALEEYVRDDH